MSNGLAFVFTCKHKQKLEILYTSRPTPAASLFRYKISLESDVGHSTWLTVQLRSTYYTVSITEEQHEK